MVHTGRGGNIIRGITDAFVIDKHLRSVPIKIYQDPDRHRGICRRDGKLALPRHEFHGNRRVHFKGDRDAFVATDEFATSFRNDRIEYGDRLG